MFDHPYSTRQRVGVAVATHREFPVVTSYTSTTQRPGVFFNASVGRNFSARKSLAQLLDNGIYIALLVLPVLVAVPYGTVEAWWTAAYESVVFGLAALWIIEGWLSGSWGTGDRALIWPALALVILGLVQTTAWGLNASNQAWRTISADPFETRAFIWKLLALIVYGVLLRRYMSNQPRLRSLIYVVIGIAVASALFGIVRQTMQVSSRGFLLPYLSLGSGYAQFINKNHFALLMEMVLGLVCGMVLGGGVRRERVLYYVAAALMMWMALVLTISRGGIFTMIIQMLFLFTILGFARVPVRDSFGKGGTSHVPLKRMFSSVALRIILMTCLLVVVTIGIVWMGGDVLVTRLQSLPGEVNPTNVASHAGVSRSEVWHATWRLFKANPVLGSGFGAYGVAITRFHEASGKWTPESAHNDYLELMASGGLIAISLVAWLAVVFIKRARACLNSMEAFQRASCIGALVGTFGVAVHSAVDFGLHITANALVFTVLVVIATSSGGRAPQTADGLQRGRARRSILNNMMTETIE